MAIESGRTRILKGIPEAKIVSTRLRVNGIVFAQVGLRPNDTFRNAFDVVVRDLGLGPFALHEEFVLEMADSRTDHMNWREISLLGLKRVVARPMGTPEVRNHREARSLGNLVPEVKAKSRPGLTFEPFPRIPVEGDTSRLDRAEEAFRRKLIQFQRVGGKGSRNRNWGHATYAVSDLLEARKCLGINQDSVSRLQKRSGLLLSTLRRTVKMMGGDVRIIAEFPDRAPVVLSELS